MFSSVSHPSRQQLHDFAESLVDRQRSVQASVASHVSQCARCKAEVAEIRESLQLTHSAGLLEPTQDLTTQILMAAKQEKRDRRPAWWERVRWLRSVGAALAVAAILATGFTTFAYALGTGYPQQARPVAVVAPPEQISTKVFTPEGLAAAVEEGAAADTPAREVLEAAVARARAARRAAEAAHRVSPGNGEALAALRESEARESALLRKLYLGQLP